MKHDTSSRKGATIFLGIAALMLCALPAFSQGGRWEARPEGDEDSEEAEGEEAPAPAQPQPVRRAARPAFRVLRPRPGGIHAEPNREAASPAVEDGQYLGGVGQSQGAADKIVGQGSGSSSGGGGGGMGGFSGRPLGSGRETSTGGGAVRSLCGTNSNRLNGVILKNTNFVQDLSKTGRNNNWRMDKGQSRSIQFYTGNAGTSGQFNIDMNTMGQMAPINANISEVQCDFSYAQVDSPVLAGFKSRACAGLRFTVKNPGAAPMNGDGSCYVLPHRTYYLNLRNEAAVTVKNGGSRDSLRGVDTCIYPRGCSFVMTLYSDFALHNPAENGEIPDAGGANDGGAKGESSHQAPAAPPQSPSSTPGWGSGGGIWRKQGGPFSFSPLPPTCNSLVVEGGRCEPGSVCIPNNRAIYYSCEG